MRGNRQPGAQAPDAKSNRFHLHSILIGLGLGTLLVLYLLQVFSPLRINTDVYRLLSMAVSAHEGNGYLVDGHVDQFPILYPFFIKTLLDFNVADSSTLVIFNLFWLGVGFSAFLALMGREKRTGGLLGIVWMLSSWVLGKHTVLPLTDCLYLGLSLASLFFATRFFEEKGTAKWLPWIVSFVLAFLSMQCRTIGVAIFPALVVVTVLHEDHARYCRYLFKHWGRCVGILVFFLAILLFGIFLISDSEWFQAQFVKKSSYFSHLLMALHSHGLYDLIKENVTFRLVEFGEIFLNIPFLRFAHLSPLYLIAGLFGWVLLGISILNSLYTKRHLAISCCLVAYCGIMLIWPYYDPRFWMPVYPLAFILIYSTYFNLIREYRVLRLASYAYIYGFIVIGILGMSMITKTSFSGDRFSEYYGDGTDRMTYRFLLQNGLPVNMEDVDMRKVELIRHFD